ncbi:spore germination lipoprotein GerD [Cytobacillus kochii]|uniref:spore germination lipoprotein GerD n=1 Tax=Cytobacillus kochii TaxID=859143 RepID=UPI0020402FBD|nr:spore germination lipoprotein GerD [Cytobacillus kochii]MCM3324192.1 spore germination lipoprotein GerD [Cytobacillus kochii]MCM3346739.1 spore germination lipoprotein GerD [Cytobacillus kochii]
MKKSLFIIPLLLILTLTACSQSGSEHMDYDQTKKMIVDILKTDDGKQALQDLMADEKIKQQLVMDQNMVTETIESTLTSEKGTEFWKKSFEDPAFAETMAKSMKSENEELLKDLMKDPDYQKMMMDILKDPEMEKKLTEVMKSQEFRAHLQTVITETFESPLFKTKLQDVLMKAAEESQSGKSGKEGGGSSSEGGGGEQGGEGEGGQDSGGQEGSGEE